ncbi:MAG: RNA methyltransferase [Thermoplasmatales archaeon]|nr:RNA methyltransferase [Thermoplasmatales archaeon]
MANVRVVLVRPKFEGNVGAIARSMANFGLDELYLVDPCVIGDEGEIRAVHGIDVLKNAVTVDTLEEALEGCLLSAGTSDTITEGEHNYVRVPITVKEFASRLEDYPEKIAVVLGREDTGLLQDELARCDLLIHIPADKEYPTLNLSHAAAIIFYELFGDAVKKPRPANDSDKERMFAFFDELLDVINYPEHRREGTSVMFRRMMGRAIPTKWEYNTILGVFKDSVKKIDH